MESEAFSYVVKSVVVGGTDGGGGARVAKMMKILDLVLQMLLSRLATSNSSRSTATPSDQSCVATPLFVEGGMAMRLTHEEKGRGGPCGRLSSAAS